MKPSPSATDPIETLDGSRLAVRPIEPSDAAALETAFRALSAESRYRRFLHPVNRLSARDLAYLTEVDHTAHEALIALDSGGEIVGVARFIRDAKHPERAEVAVTVADAWQRRGVGTQLLHRLATRAQALGVEVFTAICLDDNEEMLQLFRELGATVARRASGRAEVEVEVTLPADSTHRTFAAALRAAKS
ncbi:MAG: GNAT family N-acetyltransferase [Actinomycetota bacterium]|nr:GNAT family N-acetyltransferase [Actinomycetota bacterium]